MTARIPFVLFAQIASPCPEPPKIIPLLLGFPATASATGLIKSG